METFTKLFGSLLLFVYHCFDRVAALRDLSTRAVITSTSFTNHYEWGDLKAEPYPAIPGPMQE